VQCGAVRWRVFVAVCCGVCIDSVFSERTRRESAQYVSASHDTVTHLQHTAHCNTPHHIATPRNTLHLQFTHCNTLQYPALTYPAASPRVRPECTPGPDASALARKNGEVQTAGDC